MQNLSIQGRTMSVSRAMGLVMEDDTTCNDMWVLYKPKSDFIKQIYLLYTYCAKAFSCKVRLNKHIISVHEANIPVIIAPRPFVQSELE